MPDTTPQFPNSGDRKFRLLLVHDYPPGVHAYELQRAFEALGHEVFTVGLAGNESLDGPLRAIDPSLRYDLLLSDLDTPANELVEAAGGADFLLYLEPGRAYLPRDIHACDIPTLGLLSEEAIYADWEVPLIPSFDLVLSAWHADQRRSRARGHDHVWQWYYAGAPSFMGNDHAPRPVDFTFVGNLHPVLQRERSRVLEQITALADEEYAVELRTMIFFDEYRQALNGAKTTYAGSVTRQINMRVLEAVAAGCLVIMPTPADPDDPVSHAFEPGREIVYADTDDEVLAAIRRYSRDEDSRREITEAAERKVAERWQYRHAAERLFREILPRVPSDYRERRAERLERAGASTETHRLNRARLCLGLGDAEQAGRILDGAGDPDRDASWFNARAVASARQGNLRRAAQLMQAATDAAPDQPLYATNLACLQAHRMLNGEIAREPAGCEQVIDRLERGDPALETPEATAAWYPYHYDRTRIEIAHAISRIAPGDDQSRRLIELMRFRLHSFAGAIYAGMGYTLQSRAHMEQAAAIMPDDGYTQCALGDLYLAEDRVTDAEHAFQRTIETEPFHAEAHIKLGQIMVARNRIADAIASMRRLLAFFVTISEPERADALVVLGVAIARQGDIEGARASFEESLALKPDQAHVRNFLAQLADAERETVSQESTA